MRARPPDSHSRIHIHRNTFSQARSVPPLPRLLLSSAPAELRRIDRACLVDYSCVTPATETRQNHARCTPLMSHLEQKSPESVAGGQFPGDTCHGNAAEPCQVHPPMSHREQKSTESVAGGMLLRDTWHRNATGP